MRNKHMGKELQRGVCLDVVKIGKPYVGDDSFLKGTWELSYFEEDREYCNASDEMWVWSIGRCKKTGKYYAAFDSRFYRGNDPNFPFECVWMR